jgi:hypothetical protein
MQDLVELIQTLEKYPLHLCILLLDANAKVDDETDDLYRLMWMRFPQSQGFHAIFLPMQEEQNA